MKKLYKIAIEVTEFDVTKTSLIRKSLNGLWPWTDEYINDICVFVAGKDYTEDMEEYTFARKTAELVFKANGKGCRVNVRRTFIPDSPPCESYTFTPDDYPRIVVK